MSDRVLSLSGAARLVDLAGEIAVLRVPEPLPVGVRVALGHEPALAGLPVTGKVVEAVRRGDGFRVRLRLFNLTRTARESLAGLVGPEGASGERPGGRLLRRD